LCCGWQLPEPLSPTDRRPTVDASAIAKYHSMISLGMSALGTVDRRFFDDHVSPNLGTEHEGVRLGPQQVVDLGIVARAGGVYPERDPFRASFDALGERKEGDE
jgi:hypothetical protein